MRCWVSRSLPIGCTVVTTAGSPLGHRAGGEVGVEELAHHLLDTWEHRGGAGASYDGTHGGTARSTSAAQTRAPTNPFAPVTTTTGFGSFMEPTLARVRGPRTVDRLADPARRPRSRRRQEAAPLEFPEQGGGVGEADSVHAGGASGVYVVEVVVDVEDAADRVFEPPGEDLKDLPVGLGDAFRAGNDDVVEEIEDFGKDLRPMVDRLG